MEIFDNTTNNSKSYNETPNLEIREYKLKTYYINPNNNIYESIMDHYEGAGILKSITSDTGDNLSDYTDMLVGNKKWTASFEVSDNIMLDILKRLERHDNIINIQDEKISVLENTVKRHEVTIAQQAETIAILKTRILTLEQMTFDLSKMNLVVTCAELLKWIFKFQPEEKVNTKMFDNNAYAKSISKIIKILSLSESLRDATKTKEEVYRIKASNLINDRNHGNSHFHDFSILENKLKLSNEFVVNFLKLKLNVVINNKDNLALFEHLEKISKFEREFRFQFDILLNYEDLLKLV
ncbi:MAG: hypothetical protein ACRCZI_13350 [Cetobacterium sp.]